MRMPDKEPDDVADSMMSNMPASESRYPRGPAQQPLHPGCAAFQKFQAYVAIVVVDQGQVGRGGPMFRS